jgi:NADH:ubiquinone oxidoreductase subunit C
MNPMLDQLGEQFGRLIGTIPVPSKPPVPVASASAGPALAAGPAPQGGPPTSPSASPGSRVEPRDVSPATAAAPAPTGPIQRTDPAAKGFDLDVTVAPTAVVMAAEIMDRAGFALDAITGVDWLAQEQMEVVYDYFHPTAPGRVVVRARVPRSQPELPTISPVYPGADWHEREAHDFFDLRFTGHPNLSPFLLPEDATFHPLRKDYQP